MLGILGAGAVGAIVGGGTSGGMNGILQALSALNPMKSSEEKIADIVRDKLEKEGHVVPRLIRSVKAVKGELRGSVQWYTVTIKYGTSSAPGSHDIYQVKVAFDDYRYLEEKYPAIRSSRFAT
jgi:hypothetical protein